MVDIPSFATVGNFYIQDSGRSTEWHYVPNITNARFEDQNGDNICWAAVASFITEIYQIPTAAGMTQDEVVFFHLRELRDKAARLTGVFFNLDLADLLYDGDDLSDPDKITEMQQAIVAGNPLGIHISWKGLDVGHAICAFGTGTLQGEPAFAIYDPNPNGDPDNRFEVPISALNHYIEGVDSGQIGHWEYALSCRRPMP
ncbi:MAG: hypothetical protein AABY88_06740 [Pseudomonadota bacterium]